MPPHLVLMTFNDLTLVLVYMCVLVLKSCENSPSSCRTFGFGDSAKGTFLFFLFFGLSMLLVQLLVSVIAMVAESARRRRQEMEGVARRLCYAKSGKLVEASSIETGGYHIFLSHVWGTVTSNQDQMRVIKQRLLEMVPNFKVFLDVDDLEEIDNLDKYIRRTRAVLIFCTDGYFASKNCMIELRASVKQGKLIIPLVDPDASKGGLTKQQVREQLIKAEESCFEKWGFGDTGPSAEELFAALFVNEPIEWNRIGAFQDVTLRCIAERLLPDGHGRTYLQREIVHEKIVLQPPTKGYHVYCSQKNEGAMQLMQEFASDRGLTLKLAPSRLTTSGRRSSTDSDRQSVSTRRTSAEAWRLCSRSRSDQKTRPHVQSTTLHVTQDIDKLGECDCMLVYLTSQTWTNAEASSMLGSEVGSAMDAPVSLLLTHEMPGVGGQEGRFGCEFARFFSCDDGATPTELLRRGIYGKIAVALKGGEWRKTSMVMLAKAFAGSDAVGQEDAEELKSSQEMSKAVQQELRIPASALAVASTAARGPAIARSAAESVLDSMKEMLHHLRSRSRRLSLTRLQPQESAVAVEVTAV